MTPLTSQKNEFTTTIQKIEQHEVPAINIFYLVSVF